MSLSHTLTPVAYENKDDELRSGALVHILVVDDEPEIAASLAELLTRKEKYRVTITRDGREAMAMLESTIDNPEDAVDVVLLDVRMPAMSGPEVLSWLRGHSELKYTRVIMLTAAVGNEEKVEALTAGADDYITKPFYPLELLARVKTILRTQQLEKQLQRQSQQLVSLNRVSQAVAGRLATSDVLAVAAEGVDDVFDVELAGVFLINDDRSHLNCRHAYPTDSPYPAGSWPPIPIGRGAVGLTYSQEKGLIINDPQSDDRFQPGTDAPRSFIVRSFMAAPLFVRNKPVGVLMALNRRDGIFSEVDRRLIISLASSVGRAIEITWLFHSVRQRQQELLESRNKLQAVIDGILHPIYTIDETWQLVAVNKSKSQELDSTPEGLVGKTCYQVFYGRDMPCEHCATASTLSDKEAQHWTVNWMGADRRPREWDVNAYPIPALKAGSTQAVVVWQDRTEERHLETSLMQAGKLAAIGQLAAGVAHEINNPLTAINANAQMLQMSLESEDENYESVELIAQAGERAAKVVRGLLDFARQTEYEFEKADINSSIQRTLDLISYQFTTANINVIADLDDSLPEVSASPEHLQSVWLNLLINARDALQGVTGERKVEISTRYDQEGDKVLVVVRDTGWGMLPAELDHIFEPFYTTKAPGKGTGLGLATCHRIIEQHGGRVDVSSAPSAGTAFVVHLPVSSSQGDELLQG